MFVSVNDVLPCDHGDIDLVANASSLHLAFLVIPKSPYDPRTVIAASLMRTLKGLSW